MWIVRLALRRPYTFVVMSMMIVILGILATFRMPTDIFPEIDIPVVSVIWSYTGISPEEMAEVVTIRCERSFTTSVNDIEHMESQSLPGLSTIKVFFYPNAKVEAAVAQLAAASQAVLPMAYAPAGSWWTSIGSRSTRKGSRPTTWPKPSMRLSPIIRFSTAKIEPNEFVARLNAFDKADLVCRRGRKRA
jgi:Cu/Ag efflux pump CusA